jgi:hypothetical protein
MELRHFVRKGVSRKDGSRERMIERWKRGISVRQGKVELKRVEEMRFTEKRWKNTVQGANFVFVFMRIVIKLVKAFLCLFISIKNSKQAVEGAVHSSLLLSLSSIYSLLSTLFSLLSTLYSLLSTVFSTLHSLVSSL